MPHPFNTNSIGPQKYEPEIRRRVFFTGNTALKRGMAVVWDFAPAAGQPAVLQCVKVPTSTYKYHFAGVVLEDKAASADGQWVDIALPGSVCDCLVGPAVTAGSTTVVFSQTDGKFGKVSSTPEVGTGTALALETNATAAAAGRLIKCWLLGGNDATAPAYAYSA
jgi:hypothetical protein